MRFYFFIKIINVQIDLYSNIYELEEHCCAQIDEQCTILQNICAFRAFFRRRSIHSSGFNTINIDCLLVDGILEYKRTHGSNALVLHLVLSWF